MSNVDELHNCLNGDSIKRHHKSSKHKSSRHDESSRKSHKKHKSHKDKHYQKSQRVNESKDLTSDAHMERVSDCNEKHCSRAYVKIESMNDGQANFDSLANGLNNRIKTESDSESDMEHVSSGRNLHSAHLSPPTQQGGTIKHETIKREHFVEADSPPAKRHPSTRPAVAEDHLSERDTEEEEEKPLSARCRSSNGDTCEDQPLSSRQQSKRRRRRNRDGVHLSGTEEEDISISSRATYDNLNKSSKMSKSTLNDKSSKVKRTTSDSSVSESKRAKKEEEGKDVWRWWEEDQRDDGIKWRTLEHKGPLLAPEYEPLPDHVHFLYSGQPMKLSLGAEEVATFYGKMLDHEYTSKEVFNRNFYADWRKYMTHEERKRITSLSKCDFSQINEYFKLLSEKRKNRTKEEKKEQKLKEQAVVEEYGFCMLDGHRERIGNFRVEPPGLFRGRGEHPKQGMVKRRITASDVTINCGKNSVIPKPPGKQKWKSVQFDNTVTWLARWEENIQGQIKYVMLNAASRLKGEKDWQKYEVARRLHKCVDRIRSDYEQDFRSKEMRIRQRAVAMYFIDRLALRAGNEKDEDQADTVGCCSLRVEHIRLHETLADKQFVVVFDFLGKDSIRYYNEICVEKRVFKNLSLFCENKNGSDDLFDRLNTTILNKYLNDLMDGLTAKVFRTYNASYTLQQQLDKLTEPSMSVNEKILAYNRANRAVAVLCNHQRSVPKTFEKSMQNLASKIEARKEQLREAEIQLKAAKKAAKHGGSRENHVVDVKRKAVERISEQINKLELSATDKEENKEIALGTSKLNYLDPRISVGWCKKWNVPIEKVYNKTQRDKFRWAIDMADSDFQF